MMRITHIPIFVQDQDEALEFYQRIGFNVQVDSMLADGFRWLTITLPKQRDFEFVLMPATSEDQLTLVGNQADDIPLFYIQTDDVDKVYQQYRRHSIEVVQEPIERPWGREAQFADLYGNIFGIYKPK